MLDSFHFIRRTEVQMKLTGVVFADCWIICHIRGNARPVGIRGACLFGIFGVPVSAADLPPSIFNVLSVADVAQTAALPPLTSPDIVSPVWNRGCAK